MKKTTALAIVIALASVACVTLSPQYHQGVKAEISRNWDEAIAAYERASLENPKEPVYRLALEQAKIKAGLFFQREARRLLADGKKDEAAAAYAKAVSINPRDAALAFEAKQALSGVPKEAELRPTKIEFPIKLKAKEGALDLRLSAETSLRSVFQSLGRAGGINIVFEEAFRGETSFATDLSNVTFEQALKTICQATKNFSRVIDERTVLIVPDLLQKRMQYEVNCIKTFYLSNAKAEEMMPVLMQMLRTTGGQFQPLIVPDKALNSLSIRSTPQVVELAEKLIRLWDKPKGEVVIDIEIMEVSRTKLRQLGISFDQNILGLRYGGVPDTTTTTTATTTSNWFNLKGIDLSAGANYAVSLPLGYLQFLESDTDTKMIAQPRLRGVADEELHQLVGQQVPIPSTTFQPFAAGGYAQQPITQTTFKDVGIDIKFTPRVHAEKEVTLNMEFKVTSIGGKGYADIPIINNRELKGVLRLKDGETTLIAGLLRDEERKTIKGIPWLKDIPGIGRLFGAEDTTIEQTDIIMTITPYIIRAIPMNVEDGKALWVDLDIPAANLGGIAAFDEGLLNRDFDPEGAPRPLSRAQTPGSGLNRIQLSPASLDIPVGREFTMTINVMNEAEVGTLSLSLNFNPRFLNLKSVAEGSLGRSLGDKVPFLQNVDNNAGICTIGFSSPQIGKGVRNGGSLATLRFEAKAAGEAIVAITNYSAAGGTGQAVNFQVGEARIRVR